MDLDSDGTDDLIVGSYSGGVSFHQGLGGGKYGPESKIVPKAKDYAKDLLAVSPCAGDWDGDGYFDLALGSINGPIQLLRNEGKGKLVPAGSFTVNGKPIKAHDGGPCLADWDGDGLLDLVLGDDGGNVTLHRGTKLGSLELTEGKALLPPQSEAGPYTPAPADPKTGLPLELRPGSRVKPFVFDWNADGKPDLLVGDFKQVQQPSRQLNDEEKRSLTELDAAMRKAQDEFASCYEALLKRVYADLGMSYGANVPPERSTEFNDALNKAIAESTEFKECQDKLTKLRQEIETLRPSPKLTGFVYLYLRKP